MKKIDKIREEYCGKVSEYTDAPPLFIEASFWFIVSSTLGKYFNIVATPNIRIPLKPNLWIILSGRSGITRKSTIIEISLAIIEEAYKTYYREIYGNTLKEEALIEKINNMKIEFGSPEGILDHIVDTMGDNYIIYSHEFGGILMGLKEIEYMKMLASVLSRLYSGEEIIWKGVKKKRIIRPGLYTTALLATQELWLYADNYIFQQGLMRRTLIVYQKPEDKLKWLPPLDDRRALLSDEIKHIGKEIGEYMAHIEREKGANNEIYVVFSEKAREKINRYALEQEKNTLSETGNYALYCSTLWQHIVKVSTLNAVLSKNLDLQSKSSGILAVDENDIDEAIRFLNKTLPRAKETIMRTETRVVQAPIIDTTPVKKLIHEYIRNKGAIGSTYSELLREVKISRDELKKLLIELIEEERIVPIQVVEKKRTTIYFVDKEKENEAQLRGKTISVDSLKTKWGIT